MMHNPFPVRDSRIGFHYFPDTTHYTENDLAIWLPRLKSLQASWLLLKSPLERAIPESFLSAISRAGIEPLITFDLEIGSNQAEKDNLEILLRSYQRWGAHGIIFHNKPNSIRSWLTSDWAHYDLVERYLDRFVSLADMAWGEGLLPVFAPLEPGGSYWDTIFLRSALESLQRRKVAWLEHLVLSAYAYTGYHSLNWGAGGPSNWPDAVPYTRNSQQQDQRGFRAFEWYQAISEAVCGTPLNGFIFGIGQPGAINQSIAAGLTPDHHCAINLAVVKLLQEQPAEDPDFPGQNLNQINHQTMAGFFWLLAADEQHPSYSQAWFQGDLPQPCVDAVTAWLGTQQSLTQAKSTKSFPHHHLKQFEKGADRPVHPIKHYLLLPKYEWGVADWHLDIIRPFILKHQPTIGFSVEEAALAAQITVIGNLVSFPEEQLDCLRKIGCVVDRISGDGTTIASQLAER
jgi:hypothetical protein